MIKVFISQPMRGKSEEEILATRSIIEQIIQKKLNGEAEIVDSYFEEYPCAKDHKNLPLKFLAKSIDKLAEADVMFMLDDGNYSRGCSIELNCAVEYGLIVHRIFKDDLLAFVPEEDREGLNKLLTNYRITCR